MTTREQIISELSLNQPTQGLPWNAIYIFSDETQIEGISTGLDGRVPNAQLTKLTPLITYLQSIQNPDTQVSLQGCMSINVYNELFLCFIPKSVENKTQKFDWDATTEGLVTDLADELLSIL